ncbi:energy-coupling factor transporter transmembrane component T family protein [Clostridium cylindrosporum]|uniref:ABC-type cobalt transport system permease protein n=1 Tax=Clostridium cylindrosporum DSM 605 TaxID=1121307 RepID=A0A0J8DCP8_CLOCY|nr:energy-coupling factor transporter transmembrane component T [Clostridium cylindrosporum]KMT22018.1 ABC-type cobalt transport system permease protein [Clostridium cylindrosporum DSM 605]
MAGSVTLSYIKKDSIIHNLTGATKLVFFLLWSIAAMFTYDTPVLLSMFIISLVLFRVSKIKFKEVKVALTFMAVLIIMNIIAIYIFSPEHGVKVYGTRHEVLHIIGNYTITLEQLFYMFNFMLKYLAVIPVALLFILATDPSEFASSLNRIGVSYKVGYAVAIALRYIPDIQKDYYNISKAQQAKGVELSKKDKFHRRLKNSATILLPLIISSINRIDVISNAMQLRGFGKNKKRTWYAEKPLRKLDIITLIIVIIVLILSFIVTFYDGNRFYNPFVK